MRVAKKQYKYVLFDLDGTLTDPFEGITKCFEYSLNAFGIEVADRRELACYIGPPLRWTFHESLGFSEEQTETAIEKYRERFSTIGLYENRLYDDTISTLQTLKSHGLTLAVATSKPLEFAEKILEKFNILQFFDFVGGAEMDNSRSKKEEVIAYVLEKMQVADTLQAVMIGDRMYDIEGARRFGIETIAVLSGYGSREEFEQHNAAYIAENLHDILQYIL